MIVIENMKMLDVCDDCPLIETNEPIKELYTDEEYFLQQLFPIGTLVVYNKSLFEKLEKIYVLKRLETQGLCCERKEKTYKMIINMNNLTINRLEEISQECYKILCDCNETLENITEEKFNINHKLTKENFENFLKKINSNDNKLDAEEYLIKNLREIKEIFKDYIDMVFPFYQLCDIQIKKDIGYLEVIIKIAYNYKGKAKYYKDIIPLDIDTKKHIASFEATLNLLRVI